MRYLITLALLLFTLPCLSQDPVGLIRLEPTMDNGSESKGSCFFIDSNRVLTAWHVVRNHIENGAKIRLEYDSRILDLTLLDYDKLEDIALLETSYACENYICIAGEIPYRGEKLTNLGYAWGMWGLTRASGPYTSNIITTKADGETIWYKTNSLVYLGMSGGPLLNDSNEAVGVLIRKTDLNEAFNVNLPTIRKFLQRFAAKKTEK